MRGSAPHPPPAGKVYLQLTDFYFSENHFPTHWATTLGGAFPPCKRGRGVNGSAESNFPHAETKNIYKKKERQRKASQC